MKKIYLKMRRNNFIELKKYLLQDKIERVVFMYLIEETREKEKISFNVAELDFIRPNDSGESCYSLELKEKKQAEIIKKAWGGGYLIGEAHSHPFSKNGVCFSYTDLSGFEEFVPHIWWRLNNRPYIALVFSQTDFDALAWINNPTSPEKIEGIIVDGKLISPTNNTINILTNRKKYDS